MSYNSIVKPLFLKVLEAYQTLVHKQRLLMVTKQQKVFHSDILLSPNKILHTVSIILQSQESQAGKILLKGRRQQTTQPLIKNTPSFQSLSSKSIITLSAATFKGQTIFSAKTTQRKIRQESKNLRKQENLSTLKKSLPMIFHMTLMLRFQKSILFLNR